MLRNRVQDMPAASAGDRRATVRPSASATHVTDKSAAEAWRLYETTDLTQTEIARRIGASRATIARLAKRNGWTRRSADRARVVSRIRAEVDKQINAVEAVLAGPGAGAPDAAATHARTLASLVRSLRELQKYEAGQTVDAAEDDDADGAPADLDVLRDALADRLARLRGEDA